MCADVVIIGAGPIGCWTAIQAKWRNPNAEIKIYERREEYQRDHMMSIHRNSLLRYSAKPKTQAQKSLFAQIAQAQNSAAHLDGDDALTTNMNGGVKDMLSPVTHIRTLDLERILKAECERLNIQIDYQEIESPEQAMEQNPECAVFIAADGAHSKMRKALLGEDDVYKRDLLSSVDLKYQVQGQAHYMNAPTFDKMDMLVIETIGREDNGQSEVALRFLVDDETYDNLPHATFKEPVNFKTIIRSEGGALYPAGSKMVNSMDDFLNLREEHTGEVAIEGTERISKIRLSQYASKKFAVKTQHQGRQAGWFFVGDAAMGLPFYRSVNNGLMMGGQLASIVSNKSLSLGLKKGAYQALRPFKLAREFGAVSAKLSGVRFYKNAVRPVLRGIAIIGIAAVLVPIAAVALMVNPRARLM